MSASSFFSGMSSKKLMELLIPLCNNLVTGQVFPIWKAMVPMCAIGTYWRYNNELYQVIKESGTMSQNGVQIPGSDGLQYWRKVDYSPLHMGDDELTILTELNQLRQSSIGRPQWATSTTAPTDHVLVNGDFISFASRPEFKAKYDAGGFAGLLMPYNADAATRVANKGMFRPDAAIPTGLYLPVDGGAYYQAWTAAANGTAGGHLNAGLPNVVGELTAWTQGNYAPIRDDATLSGPFYKGTWTAHSTAGTDPAGRGLGINLGLANSIYGNSTTVTPDTIKRPVIMYLGRSDKVLSVTSVGKSWLATSDTAGFGRIASLADALPGSTISNGPAFLDAATFKVTKNPTAETLPMSASDGFLDPTWQRSMLCNSLSIFVTSGTFVPPVTGWYLISVKGGGGGGGSCKTVSGSNCGAGGGGASGQLVRSLQYLIKDKPYSFVIGAGGIGQLPTAAAATNAGDGGSTIFYGETTITALGGGGGSMASNNNCPGWGRASKGYGSCPGGCGGWSSNIAWAAGGAGGGEGGGAGGTNFSMSNSQSPTPAPGMGLDGWNGTGGGGGGASGANGQYNGIGGNGGSGRIEIQFFDPTKTS